MNDSSNICLACGICCDGTLIGFVEVAQEELPRLNGIHEVENVNGHSFFLQPCDKFCDGCSIYPDRPNHCASFKCDLLKSVEAKELNFNSAKDLIKIVKQKKAAIEKKIELQKFKLKSKSFYFKMEELKMLLEKKDTEASLTQNQLELKSDLKELNKLLTQNFVG